MNAVADFLRRIDFVNPVETLYIGGGTPDLLTLREMTWLFDSIAQLIPLSSDCEISCELNPEVLTADKLALLNERVTRLSLGVQSFDPVVRDKLMRKCSEKHLRNALDILNGRKCKHFNIDLIYGVAGVGWEVFEKDLRLALDAGVDHLSCYALTAEENSRLGLRSPVAENSDAAEWWLRIGEYLNRCRLDRYEVSNYALPGCGCRHNLNVWRGGTLLGVGASASGFDGVDRYTHCSSVDGFIAGEPPEIDRVSPAVRMLEIFAVNLRTVQGWRKQQWNELYNGSWNKLYELCSSQADLNPQWWDLQPDKIALTENGLLFWDEAAMEIISWDGWFEK